MVTAHHMNMVACENPASNETYWFVIEYIYRTNHPKNLSGIAVFKVVERVQECSYMVGIEMLYRFVF